MSHGTGISIIIRTSNSEEPLCALLSQLKIGPDDEIIVVDTGSKDGTVALAEKARAKVIRNNGPFNYSKTLNAGFEAARNGQALVFSVHCVPVKGDFLERYREVVARLPETWAVVYGMHFFSRSQYEKYDKTLKIYAENENPTLAGGGGNPNALYSKRAWEMHRFDESLKTGEDVEWLTWASRAGLPWAQAAEASAFYRHPGGPVYRFKKAREEVWISGNEVAPLTVSRLAIGIAHASKHLLWEEFQPRVWLGQVAHVLGIFAASRKLRGGNRDR
jgi:glycosyltransferase involved in cell wall biosynthesis